MLGWVGKYLTPSVLSIVRFKIFSSVCVCVVCVGVCSISTCEGQRSQLLFNFHLIEPRPLFFFRLNSTRWTLLVHSPPFLPSHFAEDRHHHIRLFIWVLGISLGLSGLSSKCFYEKSPWASWMEFFLKQSSYLPLGHLQHWFLFHL